MSENLSYNKRIAKNSLLLYLRMLLMMAVNLYTSRVILQVLGIEDYGIYNVVGGVITLFTFMNGGLVSATQRYLTFEIGRGNIHQLKKVFSTTIQIHALLSLVIVLLGETIGLWFLCEKLLIPADRMDAAIWVYQCSIIACVVNIMSVPYNADIVAHEKMSAFAYISVFESLLKLLITYLLYLIQWDKLISYALFLLLAQVLIRFVYTYYCSKNFEETHYFHDYDKSLFKEISTFAGWSFTTSIAYVLSSQGINMMLNMFFGPSINAARAIAVQIQMTVRQFVNGMQMAINPQITKKYASSQLDIMYSLMSRSARFSYYLLYLISLPILIKTEYILSIWLENVPVNTVIFTRLILILTLLYPFSNPLIVANQATGNVRLFELSSGVILLFLLPLSYVVLKFGGTASTVFIIHIILEVITLLCRLVLIRKEMGLPISFMVRSAILPAIVVTLTSCVLPLFVSDYLNNDFVGVIIISGVSACSVILFAFLFGMTKNERNMISVQFSSIINKMKFHG